MRSFHTVRNQQDIEETADRLQGYLKLAINNGCEVDIDIRLKQFPAGSPEFGFVIDVAQRILPES